MCRHCFLLKFDFYYDCMVVLSKICFIDPLIFNKIIRFVVFFYFIDIVIGFSKTFEQDCLL